MINVFVLIYRTWRTLLQPLIVVDFAEDLEAEEVIILSFQLNRDALCRSI